MIESAPSWTSDESEPAPEGGGLEQARALAGSLEEALDQSEPRWASERPEWLSEDALPPTREQELSFAAEDRARLDAIFQRHLPRRFGPDAKPRAGQLEVARQVADSLGSKELLLVHAPTGTGKTLAYLVPLCLWSARHSLRVGVATYTRA